MITLRAYPGRLWYTVGMSDRDIESERERVRRDWRIPDELWAAPRAAAAPAQAPPAGLPPPARPRPGRHGRHLLRAAHRLPVERPQRHRHLLLLLGPPALPGVGPGRRLRAALGRRAWPSTTNWSASTGSGWPWTGPSPRRRACPGARAGGGKGGAGARRSAPAPSTGAKAGTKRSLLTEAAGVPVGLAVAGANVNDHKLVRQTLACLPAAAPGADGGRAAGPVPGRGLRLRRGAGPGRRVRLHAARARAGRGGAGPQAGGRVTGPAAGWWSARTRG